MTIVIYDNAKSRMQKEGFHFVYKLNLIKLVAAVSIGLNLKFSVGGCMKLKGMKRTVLFADWFYVSYRINIFFFFWTRHFQSNLLLKSKTDCELRNDS